MESDSSGRLFQHKETFPPTMSFKNAKDNPHNWKETS